MQKPPANPPSNLVDQKQLAAFLSRSRSLDDICKEFDLTSRREALANVDWLCWSGFDITEGPKNIDGTVTIVAVRATEKGNKGRLWRWQQEPTGQPYGAVYFPPSYAPDRIKIIPIDGIHFGSPLHDSEAFDAVIDRIAADDNMFCFLNGDILSEVAAGPQKQRDSMLVDQAAAFTEKMSPIASKIIWAQQGCLEARSFAKQGFDPLGYFCEQHGIPYFKEPCYIDLHWGGNIFTVWAMHGHSTAQTKGARMNALRRPASIQDWTHFIVAGHVGDAMWNRVIKVIRDPMNARLVPREEFHVILGNFKRFLGTPSARKGHQPPSSEIISLQLYPDGKTHVNREG